MKGWYFQMKKILALVLSLMMVFACASAMAENAVYFDEAVYEAMPGEFYALDGVGLMIYVPEGMQMMEMSEDDIAAGGLMALSNGTVAVSVAYAPVADDAGNPLLDLESVHAYYNASGMQANIGVLNDLACVTFLVPGTELGGVVFPDGEGGILAFTFNPVSDVVSAVMISSIMAYEQ